MNQYLHPETQVPIQGMRIGPGRTLQKTDCYASTSGDWERVPGEGLILREGCPVVLVRPNAELSPEGITLLSYLAEHDFCLTERTWWIIIPSPRWRHDGRMDWRVLHPECVDELMDYGFIKLDPEVTEIYRLTDAGRQAAETAG